MIYQLNSIISSILSENTVLYHGCYDYQSFKGISKYGLLPKVTKETKGKNGKTVPMIDSVYLTKNLTYAMIYAFGCNMIGHILFEEEIAGIKKDKNIRYGYIFEFDSASIPANIKPDEDAVGELFYAKVHNQEYTSDHGKIKISSEDIPEFIVNIASYYAHKTTYKKAVKYDDFGDISRIGKTIIKYMSDEQKQYLANLVDEVSVIGKIMPSHCYRINKLDRAKYKIDASNFFELAKQLF